MFGIAQIATARVKYIAFAILVPIPRRANGMNTSISKLLLVIAAMAIAGCSTTSKTMAPAAQPAPMAAAPTPAPSYVIEGVHFEFDKSTLRPSATATLTQVAGELRQQSGVRYEIAGHTDSSGSDAYNQRLSEQRAEAVRSYLVGQGVSPGQLSARGYGETRPVVSNETSEGRAQNRRVEIRPVQ
jgi:outer membrane protein OmpA-like peptidoglycan-associated protein